MMLFIVNISEFTVGTGGILSAILRFLTSHMFSFSSILLEKIKLLFVLF